MPVHSGSFNKRRVSATKERKIKERVAKKRQAIKQKHDSKKLAVSGRRTGMAMLTVRLCWWSSHIYYKLMWRPFLLQGKQQGSVRERRGKQ